MAQFRFERDSLPIAIQENRLVIDGRSVELEWPILDAIESSDRIFVLFDPDRCHFMQGEKGLVLRPGPVIPNLIAIQRDGTLLWEAGFPQPEDYYYRIASSTPLAVYSFSCWRCEIDPGTGAILTKVFCK